MTDEKNKIRDEEIIEKFKKLVNLPSPEAKKRLLNALDQITRDFRPTILQYQHPKNPIIDHRQYSTDFTKGLSKGKTYFFHMAKVTDQSGSRWELANSNLKEEREGLEMVLSNFKRNIEAYKIDLIQSEIIELPDEDKSFKIGFKKLSEERLVGFIKELEEEEKSDEDFVIRDDSTILKVTSKYKNLKKQDMYEKIKGLMKQHPELIEDIFFYSFMVLNPG